MNQRDFPSAERLHATPRDQGKQAYRNGLTLRDNPYRDPKSSTDWSDGWIYQQVNYPRHVEAEQAKRDLACLSPWKDDDSGYGGNF